MPTELRDCAEDSKILERQVTYMPSGQIGEEDIAELEALIGSGAKRRRMVFSSERDAVSPSRLEELSSDDDTRNDSKASPVQHEYTREQELFAWALIIVILVISVIAFYLLWAKANGTV
jgi:hypothetical protein